MDFEDIIRLLIVAGIILSAIFGRTRSRTAPPPPRPMRQRPRFPNQDQDEDFPKSPSRSPHSREMQPESPPAQEPALWKLETHKRSAEDLARRLREIQAKSDADAYAPPLLRTANPTRRTLSQSQPLKVAKTSVKARTPKALEGAADLRRGIIAHEILQPCVALRGRPR